MCFPLSKRSTRRRRRRKRWNGYRSLCVCVFLVCSTQPWMYTPGNQVCQSVISAPRDTNPVDHRQQQQQQYSFIFFLYLLPLRENRWYIKQTLYSITCRRQIELNRKKKKTHSTRLNSPCRTKSRDVTTTPILHCARFATTKKIAFFSPGDNDREMEE
jgi:hypothetical protein